MAYVGRRHINLSTTGTCCTLLLVFICTRRLAASSTFTPVVLRIAKQGPFLACLACLAPGSSIPSLEHSTFQQDDS